MGNLHDLKLKELKQSALVALFGWTLLLSFIFSHTVFIYQSLQDWITLVEIKNLEPLVDLASEFGSLDLSRDEIKISEVFRYWT